MLTNKKVHNYTDLLTSLQKSKLKGFAHHLKPIVQIGTQGFSETVLNEIISALEKHELIKIQLPSNTDADTKKNNLLELSQILPKHSHLVGRIGRNIILYYEKDPQNAKITLKSLQGVKK